MKDGFKDQFLEAFSHFSIQDKIIFDRLYKYWETKGELVPPEQMLPWIESTFGSRDAVTIQHFIKITNIVFCQGSIFNELRTQRPIVVDSKLDDVIKEIESGSNGPFAHPLTSTPADIFGRVKGKHCITASNITKYDGLHGLIIFDSHNPLYFTKARMVDYFQVAKQWFDKAHETNKDAVYPFFTWNCLWNAGASIIHGHMQVALTEWQAYAKVEGQRLLTHQYLEKYNSSYFDDNFHVHKKLGLGNEKDKTRVLVSITPIKEKELIIYSPEFDDTLAEIVCEVLNVLKNELGVLSFNMAVVPKPMTHTSEPWDHMPVTVHIVDRGGLSNKTADIGSMELYAQSVIGSNPYKVYDKLKSIF